MDDTENSSFLSLSLLFFWTTPGYASFLLALQLEVIPSGARGTL